MKGKDCVKVVPAYGNWYFWSLWPQEMWQEELSFLLSEHEQDQQILSLLWEQYLSGKTRNINYQQFLILCAGLRDREVFQDSRLQRDTSGVQWSQHVSHSSSSQLYQRWGLQLSGTNGRVSPAGCQKWFFVRFLFLVEGLLQAFGS